MRSIKDTVEKQKHSFIASGEIFRHLEYVERPERGCHSLTRRIEHPINAAFVKAAFDALIESQSPIVNGFKLWMETLKSPSNAKNSIAYKERELIRPVNMECSVGRILVLTYADGVTDLIVVTHRARNDLADLHQIILLLTSGSVSNFPLVEEHAQQDTTDFLAQQDVAWGCGNLQHANRSACTPMSRIQISREDAPELVIAAVGVLLSRYGAEQSQVALLHSQFGAAHELKNVSFNVSNEQALTEFFDAATHATPLKLLAVASTIPTIGILLTESINDDRYISCFGPVFPITFVWEHGQDGCLMGHLWYDESHINPIIAAQVVRHINLLIDSANKARINGKMNIKAAEITLFQEAEVKEIIEIGRPPAPPQVEMETIHGMFEKLAASQPDALAVSDEVETISYCELNKRAEELATGLYAYGVRRGDRVGVCLDRKIDLIVTLLAILKADATYVPMDAKYPQERLLYTIADAKLSLIVSDAKEFPVADSFNILTPSQVRLLSAEVTRAVSSAQPSDGAYVIYTSGSTGQPKGVVIPHQNVASLLTATKEEMSLSRDDTWTLFHSSAFDFSVWEIWGCLLTGGHLLVVSYWVSRSPEEFYDLLVKQRVTILNQTPSAFSTLQAVDEQRREQLSLRLVIFGGEALNVRTLSTWFRRHPSSICQLINMYGITETTVHVTLQKLTPVHVQRHSKSVGKALPGWSISVRDKDGQVQPFGVAGEIYVGGGALATEYLGRSDLTEERFICDRVTGERVYRSGDLGRLHPDGTMDHLGRIDSQVKIRGFRIELDEIRSVILNDSGVKAAAVLLNQGKEGDAASVQIDAYIVLQESITVDMVRRRIAQYLPEYMMPSSFNTLSQLPVTANGKLDVIELKKHKLAQLSELSITTNDNYEDTDNVEHKVLSLWQKVLDRNITMHDDFFDSGGNSLIAVNLSAELRKLDFGSISLRDLFQHSTPAALCVLIKSRQNVVGAQ